MSSSTFTRLARGCEEPTDHRRLRSSIGPVTLRRLGPGCGVQNSTLSKGCKLAVENVSDSEGRAFHSLTAAATGAAAVGTNGGEREYVNAFLRKPKQGSNELNTWKFRKVGAHPLANAIL
jgi:hypothetical protein